MVMMATVAERQYIYSGKTPQHFSSVTEGKNFSSDLMQNAVPWLGGGHTNIVLTLLEEVSNAKSNIKAIL